MAVLRLESLVLFSAVIASGYCAAISIADRESECYAQEKVFHAESGKCYKLLTKGPCDSGEWLVLEKPEKGERRVEIKPVCAKEKCQDGEYYWPAKGGCVASTEIAELCGESGSEELANNVFGEGECVCAREPPTSRLNGDEKNPCYQLYSRGPCPTGQVLALPRGELTKAVCVDDPCFKESLARKKSGTLSADGILAPSENGTCHELGTQGPCSEDLVFKVHSVQKQPTCTSLLNNIFGGIKQCPVDENGDCQREVVWKQENKFLKELEGYLKN